MIVGASWTLYQMRAAIFTGLQNANPFSGELEDTDSLIRTEQDISQKKAMGAALMFLIPIFIIYYHFSDNIGVSALSSVLMLITAFLFAAIAGYIAGLIGSSSNPISGITIATLLFVSVFLVLVGMKGDNGMTTAIGVAAVVCTAAAIAGDVMQDLKTGQLVGSTPRVLQLGEYLGVAIAAAVIPFVLYVLFDTYTFGVPGAELAAPQAGVMQAIVEGVFEGTMKWDMVGLGMAIAMGIIVYSEVTKSSIPIMAVAIGLYLPIIMVLPILVGGILKQLSEGFIEHRIQNEYVHLDDEEKENAIGVEKKGAESKGILFASGLIAGEALAGIGIAVVAWRGLNLQIHEFPVDWPGLLLFVYFSTLLAYIALRDFIEDMSFGEIITSMKGAINASIYGFLHPEETEDEEMDDSDEEYNEEDDGVE